MLFVFFFLIFFCSTLKVLVTDCTEAVLKRLKGAFPLHLPAHQLAEQDGETCYKLLLGLWIEKNAHAHIVTYVQYNYICIN